MASIMEPMMGMAPMARPICFLPVRSSVHLPKASTGPAAAQRPSANSSITPEEPMRTTKMK